MSHVPINRWQDSASESLARRFLDAASPIILEGRIITAERHQRLAGIANRLGMSEEQMEFELRLLAQRGVISCEVEFIPKSAVATGEVEFSNEKPFVGVLVEDDQETVDGPPDGIDFETPPPPVKPPPLPTPEMSRAQPPPINRQEVERSAPTPIVRAVQTSGEDRVTTFLEKAVVVLAKHKTLTSECQVMLLAEASTLGLSPDEAWDAIGTLLQKQTPTTTSVEEPPANVAAPPVANPDSSSTSQRPDDAYREFLFTKMGQLKARIVSEKIEKQLARVGKKEYKLSSVYMRHLLYEVADKTGVRILTRDASQGDDAPQDTTNNVADERLQRFLQQVAPIIAEYRGINARSRILMAAVAAEEGLSDDELQAAISSLQESPASGSDSVDEAELQLQERRTSFEHHLREAMSNLPRGVLTPKLRDRLTEAGEMREGLSINVVEETIRAVSTDLQVQQVSESNANEHLLALIDVAMTEDFQILSAARTKLYTEGKQWGLSPTQVDELIDARVEGAWADNTKVLRRNAILIGTAVTTVFGLFVTLVLVVASQKGDSNDAVVGPTLETTETNNEATPIIDDSWWSADLSIAVTNARVNVSEWRGELDRLRSSEASSRQTAYRGLLRACKHRDATRETWRHASEIFLNCYALEPEDDNAAFLRDELLKLVPSEDSPPNADAWAFQHSFPAVTLLVDAMCFTPTSDERAASIATALSTRLGINVRATMPHDQALPLCKNELAKQAYRFITTAAPQEPNSMAEVRKRIVSEGVAGLTKSQANDLDADFLIAALPAVGDDWRQFEDTIKTCVAKSDPIVVLRLTNFYGTLPDGDLQDRLGALLAERAGVNDADLDVSDVISKVSQAMGSLSSTQTTDRWLQLKLEATRLLNNSPSSTDNSRQLLSGILTRVRLNTLGLAAARGSAGDTTFDSLLGNEAPVLPAGTRRSPVRSQSTNRRTDDRQRASQVRRSINLISNERFGKKRMAALSQITLASDSVAYISRSEAVTLAKYFLKPRDTDDEEHLLILESLPKLARWRRLPLAISEQVMKMKSADPDVHALLEVVGGEVEYTENLTQWQERWRVAMLKFVLDDLSGVDIRPVGAGQMYDDCRDLLIDSYSVQASMLAVSPDAIAAAKEPVDLLAKMIPPFAAQLKTSASGNDLAFLERHAHEVIVADYFASNGIERLAALQRVWLRLVEIYVVGARPDLADEVDAIASGLSAKDRQATDVFAQLHGGEQAILDMWLLMAEEARK